MDKPTLRSHPMTTRTKFVIADHWALASGFGPDSIASAAINQNMLSYQQHKPLQAVWDSVMTMLDLLNEMAVRWPLQVRLLLSENRSPSYGIFGATSHPRDVHSSGVRRRQQEMSVWANMLCFIAACWDISCRELERMGLFLSENMKAHIENLNIWGGLGGNRKRIEEAAKDFFILALTDPKPSPRSNPILWWLAVLIHNRIVDRLPGLPFGAVRKDPARNVDLNNKLEALDYFVRVLVLEVLIHTWIPSDMGHRVSWPPFSRTHPSAMKQQVLTFLEHADVPGVYQDHAIYPVLQKDARELSGPAWQECIAHLKTLINEWLIIDTRGPMREILSHSKGVLPNRTYEDQPDLSESSNGAFAGCTDERYEVMIEVWGNFTDTMEAHDGGFGRATTTGAHRVESETDLAGANRAAREVIELEFGRKEYASLWMEHGREDGTVRVLALFVDKTWNSKVNTWVQRRVS